MRQGVATHGVAIWPAQDTPSDRHPEPRAWQSWEVGVGRGRGRGRKWPASGGLQASAEVNEAVATCALLAASRLTLQSGREPTAEGGQGLMLATSMRACLRVSIRRSLL